MADLAAAPSHRHHPHGAVEARNVEIDIRRAIGRNPHDAREEAQRRLGGRRGREGGTGIAAGAQPALVALHAVDQQAIDIAKLGRQPLLVIVIFLRRRRIVACQVENADIDGGNRDIGFLAGGQAVDLHRHFEAAARRHLLGRAKLQGKRAGLAVDAEPGNADRTGGHALGRHIHRPIEGGHGVGAAAPLAADLHRHANAAGRHLDRLCAEYLVANHLQGGLAGERRVDLHIQRIARFHVGAIDCHLQSVRRGAIGAGAEVIIASREIDARRRHAGSGDLKAVFAPAESP